MPAYTEGRVNLWERFLYRLAGSGAAQRKPTAETGGENEHRIKKMSEPILVAMSAIHHVNTVLVEQDGLFSNGAYKALKCQKK